jgi:hypothetical protein
MSHALLEFNREPLFSHTISPLVYFVYIKCVHAILADIKTHTITLLICIELNILYILLPNTFIMIRKLEFLFQ